MDHDPRDRDLLNCLDADLPLVSTPFAVIGQMIDMSEKEVIKRLDRLKKEEAISSIRAQFDLRALGYESALIAAVAPASSVDRAAEIIAAHPGVSKLYRRNHRWNLWFSLAVSPGSELGLENTARLLATLTGSEQLMTLPATRSFDANGNEVTYPLNQNRITAQEAECIRLLQQELPLQPRPFEALCHGNALLDEQQCIASARALSVRRQLRRLGAIFNPKKSGFMATTLSVWRVPEDRAGEIAASIARNRAVSRCHLRPVRNGWDYNLYATVHGRSVDECNSLIGDLAADHGIDTFEALYPLQEYKRQRAIAFSPEEAAWEAANVQRNVTANRSTR